MTAFSRGKQSFQAGRPKAANPYLSKSVQHKDWAMGWEEGFQDYKKLLSMDKTINKER